jgi:hypothetical protein
MRVHVAVAVSVTVRNCWQVDDLAVSHPSFGDDVVGEFLYVFTGSLQHSHFHAALAVQVDVQRSPREIMMIMKIACETLWQFTLVMVIDVN